jgi:hypothetical protein
MEYHRILRFIERSRGLRVGTNRRGVWKLFWYVLKFSSENGPNARGDEIECFEV